MKVILLSDVKKVGKKNEVVEVAAGYANNFLIKNKLAVPATKTSLNILDNQNQEAAQMKEKQQAEANEIKQLLETLTIELPMKVGKDGRVFGSISTKQVVEALKKQHDLTIDKRKFVDKQAINSLGYTKLRVNLFKDVQGIVTVHVSELK